MAVALPNGALIHIAASYGTSKLMTAISNANPAVATLEATHGIVVGDVMEITSGWSKLTNKAARASVVTGNNVTLEGVDSSLTTQYPAGSGTGTVREVLTWTQIQQILTTASSGGSTSFVTFQFLESDAQMRIPSFKEAAGFTLTIADDPSLAGYQALSVANDDRLPRIIRITLPNAAKIFYSAYVSLNRIPKMDVNQVMSVESTLSLLNEPLRYTS
jgi:hypothetical protein